MIKGLTPEFELNFLKKGYDIVVGIDEAGRGPWAGPVAVAAYIYSSHAPFVSNINDSKKLSSQKRSLLFEHIKTGNNWRVELGDIAVINSTGIGQTIEVSIKRIVEFINATYQHKRTKIIIDGYFKTEFDCDYDMVKAADSKVYSVAAASIIAKETRDAIMRNYSQTYPVYGFDKHMGYGTKLHAEALQKYGPCPIHRTSFEPIKKLL